MKSDNVSVSVIMPVYNRIGYLSDSIKSVLSQTFSSFELIIVNDGSSEDVFSVVSLFNDPRIVYIVNKTNQGVSAARNIGIRAARGKFIAFLDSDDLWLPDALEQLILSISDKKIPLDCVYSVVYREESAGRHYAPGLFFSHSKLLVNLRAICCIHLQGVLVRRECFDSIGYFDEKLKNLEDWDILLRMAYVCRMEFLPRLTAISYYRKGGISTSKQYLLYAKEYFIEKHNKIFNNISAKADFYSGMGHILSIYGCFTQGRILLRKSIFCGVLRVDRIFVYLISCFGSDIYKFAVRVWNLSSFTILSLRYGYRFVDFKRKEAD